VQCEQSLLDTCEATVVYFHRLRLTGRYGKVLARSKLALLSWRPAAKYITELAETRIKDKSGYSCRPGVHKYAADEHVHTGTDDTGNISCSYELQKSRFGFANRQQELTNLYDTAL
jgi:hypothetical protein